ncbi:hypothetical protein LJR289_002373 [Pseudoduganella sp. LjRoot289]|uniref:hypothetical protein n=1 Tax=Pseudoduganella sp. LjRoot289 TaxID=3342314 RepID=UPI003ECF650E
MKKSRKWWEPCALIASHIGNATVIFLLFGATAAGMGILVRQLERLNVPSFTLWLLTMLDYATIITGAILYLGLLGAHTWRALKEMLK